MDSMKQQSNRRRGVRKRWLLLGAVFAAVVLSDVGFIFWQIRDTGQAHPQVSRPVLAHAMEAKFEFLSTHGNSNCSQAFMQSIPSMPDGMMLQGSCCTAMDRATYARQVEGLKKYATIPQVPPDPYDIPAALAKQLLAYDASITPTSAEQATLHRGATASNEKGYCCCQCWRWSVYEGLSKYLVRERGFNAAQITDVLNNSDGCGG